MKVWTSIVLLGLIFSFSGSITHAQMDKIDLNALEKKAEKQLNKLQEKSGVDKSLRKKKDADKDAAEAKTRFTGEILEVRKNGLKIATSQGEEFIFLNADTKLTQQGKKASREDFIVGAKISGNYRKSKTHRIATDLRLEPDKKAQIKPVKTKDK